MAVADSHGLPVGLCIESASPHEVKLVDSTLVEMVIPEAPQNLVGDNAYDSDKLDAELRQYAIELIAPHRSNRKNKSQDGRRLRRYRRRWKIESSKTSDDLLCVMNVMPIISWAYCTSAAPLSSFGIYEMGSSRALAALTALRRHYVFVTGIDERIDIFM